MKVVQAKGETSSTSKHEISNKFSNFALLDSHYHCGFGSYPDQNQCRSGSTALILRTCYFHAPFSGQCRSSWSCRWTTRGSRPLSPVSCPTLSTYSSFRSSVILIYIVDSQKIHASSPVSCPTPSTYSSFRSSGRWFMLLTVRKSMHPKGHLLMDISFVI